MRKNCKLSTYSELKTIVIICQCTVFAWCLSKFLDILPVDAKITLNGVKNLTDGDTANISCTVSGSLYEPSSMMFICVYPACTSLMNKTTQTISTVYDNTSETFTTVLQAAPVTVTKDLNEVWILCTVLLNGSPLYRGDNVTVFCKYKILIFPSYYCFGSRLKSYIYFFYFKLCWSPLDKLALWVFQMDHTRTM